MDRLKAMFSVVNSQIVAGSSLRTGAEARPERHFGAGNLRRNGADLRAILP